MLLNIFDTIFEVSKPLGEVVFCQVSDYAFGIRVELFREGDWLTQDKLEDFVSVSVHEGRAAIDELVDKDSDGVPVSCSSVTDVHDNLRGHVLGCSAESVGPLPGSDLLHKAKISDFDVAIVLH